MADDKKEKKLLVYSPDLDASKEDKEIAVKVLGNYIGEDEPIPSIEK